MLYYDAMRKQRYKLYLDSQSRGNRENNVTLENVIRLLPFIFSAKFCK